MPLTACNCGSWGWVVASPTCDTVFAQAMHAWWTAGAERASAYGMPCQSRGLVRLRVTDAVVPLLFPDFPLPCLFLFLCCGRFVRASRPLPPISPFRGRRCSFGTGRCRRRSCATPLSTSPPASATSERGADGGGPLLFPGCDAVSVAAAPPHSNPPPVPPHLDHR